MHMQSWPAAPQIIVVHCWQVVMDEAKGVDVFDRSCSGQADFGVATGSRASMPHKQRAESFAAAENRVVHGLVQADREIAAETRIVDVLGEFQVDERDRSRDIFERASDD
jgi:hypothetical protein